MPTVKMISLYSESHLPQKGWLQGCIMCEIITSITHIDRILRPNSRMTYEIHTYICPNCKRKLSEAKFNDKYKTVVETMLGSDEIQIN